MQAQEYRPPMAITTSVSKDEHEAVRQALAELGSVLSRNGTPNQTVIADTIGVSQQAVSRALLLIAG